MNPWIIFFTYPAVIAAAAAEQKEHCTRVRALVELSQYDAILYQINRLQNSTILSFIWFVFLSILCYWLKKIFYQYALEGKHEHVQTAEKGFLNGPSPHTRFLIPAHCASQFAVDLA